MIRKPRPSHQYDRTFHRYAERAAARSARTIVPLIASALNYESVLDVGCGTGAWLREYARQGAAQVLGLDAVDKAELLIAPDQFRALDVSQPFDVGRCFDLVQCLATAEHIPPEASRTLVANLTTHGRHILFSAAVPGQGGEHHVNERPYEFWRRLFAEHRFVALDLVRPAIASLQQVDFWYRYNMLLYVHENSLGQLPLDVRRTRVPDRVPIPDVAPITYRIRKALLRHVPRSVVTGLATGKHVLVTRRRESDE